MVLEAETSKLFSDPLLAQFLTNQTQQHLSLNIIKSISVCANIILTRIIAQHSKKTQIHFQSQNSIFHVLEASK